MGTLDGRLYSNVVWRFTLDPHLSQDRQPDPFTVDPQASQDRQQGPQQEEQAGDSPAEAPELPYNRCQCWAHNLHQSALSLMKFTIKGPEPLWYPLPVPTLSLSLYYSIATRVFNLSIVSGSSIPNSNQMQANTASPESILCTELPLHGIRSCASILPGCVAWQGPSSAPVLLCQVRGACQSEG